jgi:hypothetical protein
MTPKEKAMELIEKFEKEVYKYDLDTNNEYDMSLFHLAKQCALIAIDEILKITWVDKFLIVEDYWQEVKHEIEKL